MTRVDPIFGYGQSDDGFDLPPPDSVVDTIERVMRAHLPVKMPDGRVLCLDDIGLTFFGPVYHRWHVAELIKDALERGSDGPEATSGD